jgi:hypothetical protein
MSRSVKYEVFWTYERPSANTFSESFQHTPRPAPPPPGNLNVPPPSRRNYTETLVSDTPQIPRGPIMKGSLDFLNRTDSTVQKSSDSAQAKGQ